MKIPTNADVDYVLQIYKLEEGVGVYLDSPTVPGLHLIGETAEMVLAHAPAAIARLRRDNSETHHG